MKHPQKRFIHFHGAFKEEYSEEPLELYADSLFNLFNILFKDVYPDFLSDKKKFGIAIESEDGTMTELFDPEQVLHDTQKNIHIYPDPEGAYAEIIWYIVIIIVSIGVSLMLAPKLDSSQDTASGANWSTPENVVGQGGTIPVVLGERLVGSRVASYGIDSVVYKGRV